MRLLLAALLLARTTALRLNGWYPCAATSGGSDAFLFYAEPSFQCAKLELPLCHAGVCASARTTEVFVKRKLAAERPAAKSIWLLEGGPGASSSNMEQAMLLLYSMLNETVSVYTMDHRGTGRSGFLQCEAAQALAGGSPSGEELELSELADCVRDVLFEIDGLTEAYSVTSAAHDVATVLEYLEDVGENGEESDVFLYGVSYGTYLVERIMHLAPPQVKGYMLDGVLPETDFSAADWNRNILPPTQRFLEACVDSPDCPLKLKSKKTAIDEVLKMYDEIDAATDGNNSCATALAFITDLPTPSLSLRLLFALLVRDPMWRPLLPSLLARIHQCSEDDFQDLNIALLTIKQKLTEAYGGTVSASISQPWPLKWTTSKHHKFLDTSRTSTPSSMLYYLITFSELWRVPMRDLDELLEDFTNGPFSLDIDTLPAYCLVSGGFNNDSDDATCGQLLAALSEAGDDTDFARLDAKFLYDHDKYWNKTASLSDDVSALFIVGGLDFQTPSELGKREYDELKAANKLLVEFAYGAHGTGFLPTSPEDKSLCGPRILASFVAVDGDVTQVDTSCVAQLPPLQLSDEAFQLVVGEVRAYLDAIGVFTPETLDGRT